MLYITGDTHGEQTRFYDKMLMPGGMLGEKDCLIVCGDFGYVFYDTLSERLFLKDLEMLPYTIAFVDGNHENFPALYSYPVEEWNGGKVHRIKKNIVHLMRGEVFRIQGKKIFAMGGAYSIDKYMRQEGISWWHEELPNGEEYKNAADNLKAHDFKVDYIVTHTLPREMILRMGTNPDKHDLELTGFLEWVMHETEFTHWYAGHWHNELDITDKVSVLWYSVKRI